MNEQKSGKIVKIPAFRGKSPRKVRQVSPIRRQLVASHAVICGNFPDFSTTSLPEKSMYRDFSGRAVRKKRISTAIAAPTALRPEATCPTCHSGICHGFLSHRRGLFRGSVIFERSRKWWGASAVVAALWSDKPLHIHCAMAYHLHQCRKLWVQGCLQYYRLPAPYLWP